jgi:catechol 2,3-dioxygenase-like lactoylglutathione lyase family enzyme
MIHHIAPFFIVNHVPTTLEFYQEKLGFDVVYRGPSADDEFFGVVQRDGAVIMFKALGDMVDGEEVLVAPVPNHVRTPANSWDAYVAVDDPDALAEEFASRGVTFAEPLARRDVDGIRGFLVIDVDGYALFFGSDR